MEAPTLAGIHAEQSLERRALPSWLAHLVAWLLLTALTVGHRRLDPSAGTPRTPPALDVVHVVYATLAAWATWTFTRVHVALVTPRSEQPASAAFGRWALLAAMHVVASYLLLHGDVARRSALLARSVGGPRGAWGVGIAFVIGAACVGYVHVQAAVARRGKVFAAASLVVGLVLAVASLSLSPTVYPGVRAASHAAIAAGITWGLAWLVEPQGTSAVDVRSRPGASLARRLRAWGPHAAGGVSLALVLFGGAIYETPALRWSLAREPGCALAPLALRARSLVAGGPSRKAGLTSVPSGPPVAPTMPPLVDDPRPVAVFVTIDALRADVVQSRRHDAQLPTLARLRDTSVSFSNARTVAPSTLNTIDALFTSRLVSDMGRIDESDLLDPSAYEGSVRLGDLLAKGGVDTTIVQSAGWLDPTLGFFGATHHVLRPPIDRRAGIARADDVATAMIAALDQEPSGAQLVYTHFLDAHEPYDLAGQDGTPYERYLRELSLVDAALGRIVEALDRPAWASRAVLIVSADHGESFGEHGAHSHATVVYEDAVRVPLLVRAPRLAPSVVAHPVTLLDVAPTLLDVFGLETPGSMRGLTLIGAARGGALPSRLIPIESGIGLQSIVRPDGIKLIADTKSGTFEAYDLSADPDELVDLVAAGRIAPVAREELDAFFAR
jgi:hypothetical protein